MFAVLVFTFVRFRGILSDMRGILDRDLGGNPFRGLADAAAGSVQLEWGWAVLVVGAGMLIAAPLARPSVGSMPLRKCPFCAELIQPEAVICRHCRRDVPAFEASESDAAGLTPRVPRRVLVTTLLLVLVLPPLLWYMALALPALLGALF